MTPFPFSAQAPVTWPGPPPAEADVVVIGGGVIGVCTALYLARDGHRVVLLEKGRIAAEQSSRNWGWIRQQGRDLDELPIMMETNRLWRDLAQQTTADIGLVRGGVTYLALDAAALARYEAWLAGAKLHGVDSRLLTATEAAGLIPGTSRRYLGALHTPSDLRAEPWVAVPALAALAERDGARIVEGCAVRCLDITGGRVTGVVTESGRVRAPRVVLAGGAWSALFLANYGIRLPQLSVRATVIATSPLPVVAQTAAADKHIAFRPRADGGYTLAGGGYNELYVGPAAFCALPSYLPQLRMDPFGTRLLPAAPRGYPDAWLTPRRWDGDMATPFEAMRVLDPKPSSNQLRRLPEEFARLFPALPRFEIRRAWAGMIDTMPDVVPVIDGVAGLPGLILGTGMSGHGFGIGPGVGRLLATLATDGRPAHDLTRFRLSRFRDGTAMVPGPSL